MLLSYGHKKRNYKCQNDEEFEGRLGKNNEGETNNNSQLHDSNTFNEKYEKSLTESVTIMTSGVAIGRNAVY